MINNMNVSFKTEKETTLSVSRNAENKILFEVGYMDVELTIEEVIALSTILTNTASEVINIINKSKDENGTYVWDEEECEEPEKAEEVQKALENMKAELKEKGIILKAADMQWSVDKEEEEEEAIPAELPTEETPTEDGGQAE